MDKGGTIDVDELKDAFKTYGEGITDDEVATLVKQIDENGDGKCFSEATLFILGALHSASMLHPTWPVGADLIKGCYRRYY